MKITVLIENTKGELEDLINEHGLSLYIEKDNKRILFDTGKTNNFIINAQKLGINLEDIDAVVLSHGHADHGGGLLSFLKINDRAKVYMKRKVFGDYYSGNILFKKSIGINKEVFEKYSSRIEYVDNFTEIMEDIFIITDIQRNHKIPEGNKYLFVKEGNKIVNDKFEHELIMVIKENEGICVFSGCSHNGTVNMIEAVNKSFSGTNIKALIGGFHLAKIPAMDIFSTSQDEIDLIINKIVNEKIEKVYTGHCTGEKAYNKLKQGLGDKIEYIRTGSEIQI
ncbi:MAG: MBL fold metallo-hydrolase [Clostridiaceae bacterium]|nr:MBL fold metallo-hydrolase [Clostridiaceae bacterium]